MKLLVVSDTHGSVRLLGEVLQKLHKHIDIVCHLGDGYGDALSFAKRFSKLDFLCVKGNCDAAKSVEENTLLELCGKKLWLTHGHLSFVKFGTDELAAEAKARGADICLFGHTHEHTVFHDSGIVFMNPGSLTFPKASCCPTYGIVDINDGKLEASILGLQKDGLITRMN